MRAQRSGSQWVSLALLRSRGGAATNSLTKAVAVTAFSTSPFSTYITLATSRNCSDEGRKEMGMTLKVSSYWERNGLCPREAAQCSLAESSKLTCHERAPSRRTSRRWFCPTSEVVTGRKFGCTKQNICAIVLKSQRFVRF